MPRLVIVDGDVGRRRIARVIAEATGWVVEEASTAGDVAGSSPDLVLLLAPSRETSDALRGIGADVLVAPEAMADLIGILRERRRRAG